MDSEDLERVLSESEENSSSDETTMLDASLPGPTGLQSRAYKYLCFFRAKLRKVIFITA